MTQELERGQRLRQDLVPAGPTEAGSRHGPIAQLLISWSPLSVILVAYVVAGWISAPLEEGDGASTNRLGAGLHVLGPARADERVFGAVPSVWLQERLVDGAPHWYDAVAALVYVTHFVSIPLLTAVVWFCLRDRFAAWLVAVLTMSVAGIAGYVVYPAAPPWLAAERGDIGTVDRISHIGWEVLQLDVVGRLTELGQSGSNPVAAMPSLHAGAALLVALFLWPSVGVVARAALAAYALSMAVTLVYTGEHYVVDIAAGWLLAALAAAVGWPRAQRVPTVRDDLRAQGHPVRGSRDDGVRRAVGGTGGARDLPPGGAAARPAAGVADGAVDRAAGPGPVALVTARTAEPPAASSHPVRALLGAAHLGPALAVTVLAGLLATAQGLGTGRGVLVVAAVLAGQLTIGWSNDLIDAARDREAGREDKPLATGEASVGVVRLACLVAVVVCVVLSLALGLAAGLVHLGCVAAAWAYNLGLKATVWSWVPYAVSFGGLTAVVTLADGVAPPWWWPVGAALLGVGAHLLNVLPDLADDAATGVRGLPHRLGPRRIAPVAAAVLVAASTVVLVGAAPPIAVTVVAALAVLGLAVLVVTASGRLPFVAAIAIALVDTVLLVVAR